MKAGVHCGPCLGMRIAPTSPMPPRKMFSRFDGKCACGQYFKSGDQILYEKGHKPAVRACPQCTPDLQQAPSPEAAPAGAASTTEMRVKVERIKAKKDEWAALLVILDPDSPFNSDNAPVQQGQPFSVSGKIQEPALGDLLEVYGSWSNHPKYGWQFKATASAKVVGGTLEALKAFLARLPQVGARRAQDIIQVCGGTRTAVMEAIEKEPARLTAVPGITEDRAQAIHEAFKAAEGLRETAIYLAGLGLSEGLAAKTLDKWGGDAKKVLIEDPYALQELSGIGFARADSIARERFGVPPTDPRRAAAAVLHLLREEEHGFGGGHTWTDLRHFEGFIDETGLL